MRTGPVALRIRAAALSKLTKRFLTRLKRASCMSVTLTSKRRAEVCAQFERVPCLCAWVYGGRWVCMLRSCVVVVSREVVYTQRVEG